MSEFPLHPEDQRLLDRVRRWAADIVRTNADWRERYAQLEQRLEISEKALAECRREAEQLERRLEERRRELHRRADLTGEEFSA